MLLTPATARRIPRGPLVRSDPHAALMCLMKFPRMDLAMLKAVLAVRRCFPGEYSSWQAAAYMPSPPPASPAAFAGGSMPEARRGGHVASPQHRRKGRSPKRRSADLRVRPQRPRSMEGSQERIDFLSDMLREGVTRTWQNINTVSRSLQGHDRSRDEFVVAHMERIADLLFQGTLEGDLLEHRLNSSRARADLLQLIQVMKGVMQPSDCTFDPAFKAVRRPEPTSPSRHGSTPTRASERRRVAVSDPLTPAEDPLHLSLRTQADQVDLQSRGAQAAQAAEADVRSVKSPGSSSLREVASVRKSQEARDARHFQSRASSGSDAGQVVSYDFGLPERDSADDVTWDPLFGHPI
eukprot:scaffold380_cov272-Pinguiococcus_pyrenoidosus.AAC.8